MEKKLEYALYVCCIIGIAVNACRRNVIACLWALSTLLWVYNFYHR